MLVALIGAELEENLGLRYMASALEQAGHRAIILPFNEEAEIPGVVRQAIACKPDIAGLSMVFTGRAREFCRLAKALRTAGFVGHLTAGGHFAALNRVQLMNDFPEFDSIALGEGEELICALAENMADLSSIAGFCHRTTNGAIAVNPSRGNPENLDLLPFPRRGAFHEYYGKPIASILSSRGCWRSCAFCSIDAWYRSGGGRKFRIRSIRNIVAEMTELYHRHGVRVFNFQDDNFFLPNPEKALARFTELRDSLWREGVKEIAIAVKARPDTINREAIGGAGRLGIFRVFLGVENASERGLAEPKPQVHPSRPSKMPCAYSTTSTSIWPTTSSCSSRIPPWMISSSTSVSWSGTSTTRSISAGPKPMPPPAWRKSSARTAY